MSGSRICGEPRKVSFDTTSTQGTVPALHLLGLCHAPAKQCLRGTTCNRTASCQLVVCNARRAGCRAQTPAAAHASKSKGAGNRAVRPTCPARWVRAISAGPSRPHKVGPIPHLLVDAQCDQLLRPTGCTNQVRSWLHWPGTIPPFNPHIQLRLHRPAIIFMGSHCLGLG